MEVIPIIRQLRLKKILKKILSVFVQVGKVRDMKKPSFDNKLIQTKARMTYGIVGTDIGTNIVLYRLIINYLLVNNQDTYDPLGYCYPFIVVQIENVENYNEILLCKFSMDSFNKNFTSIDIISIEIISSPALSKY